MKEFKMEYSNDNKRGLEPNRFYLYLKKEHFTTYIEEQGNKHPNIDLMINVHLNNDILQRVSHLKGHDPDPNLSYLQQYASNFPNHTFPEFRWEGDGLDSLKYLDGQPLNSSGNSELDESEEELLIVRGKTIVSLLPCMKWLNTIAYGRRIAFDNCKIRDASYFGEYGPAIRNNIRILFRNCHFLSPIELARIQLACPRFMYQLL